jgi:hypothetical protein
MTSGSAASTPRTTRRGVAFANVPISMTPPNTFPGRQRRSRTAWLPACVLAAAIVPTLAPRVDAQTAAPPVPAAAATSPAFLFGRPSGWFGFRAGWLMPHAGSDWYDFVSDQLTIDDGAFSTGDISGDAGFRVASRVDAVAGVAFNRATVPSEYRDFVDNNRLPINQETRLSTVAVTGSAKIALRSPGREVSRLAWVPHNVVPFAGAGGGALYYSLEQTGDFVDFRDSRVFPSVFKSAGWVPVAHAFGGVDVRVLRSAMVTFDARYQWASAQLGSTWVDFEPLDLSGFKFSAGMQLLF